MTEENGPTYRVASYTIFPSEFDRVADPDRHNWCLTVADAGDGWAIRWRNRCLNFHGRREHEPPATARAVDFLRRCRFSERAALYRARQVIDSLEVEGMTFDEFVARVREDAGVQAREVLTRERDVRALRRQVYARRAENILHKLTGIGVEKTADADQPNRATVTR
jgi:hypothetical protein